MGRSRLAFVALLLLSSPSAFAQEPERGFGVPAIMKQVLLDPTTYAPAIVAWEATRLDWRSSQVFFRNGWNEHNARFTVSGRPDDVAVGYAAGNRRILADAVTTLQISLVNNASARVMERVLMPRYPTHRKLIRVLGWIERSAVASYLSYLQSADHFRQWQDNNQRAVQLGLR